MNILFAMYGDFRSNSAHPMALHARELAAAGHDCVAAVPSNVQSADSLGTRSFRPVLYGEALEHPERLFRDGRPADILHAWTPREGVRKFVTAYLARRPTPWVVYLEDNERWIANTALALTGMREETILQHTGEVISTWTPDGVPHVLRYESFIGLADAAVVIQDKLRPEVPPWVPCSTVMPGVDLEAFFPRPPDPALRQRYAVAGDARVIVYPGGLNDFTRPGLEALCRAVGMINAAGTACTLLRSGPVALDFLDRLPPEAAGAVRDLGALPRSDLPALFSLADLFVQPGKPDPFEDLRLPGKLPELFASGRPWCCPRAISPRCCATASMRCSIAPAAPRRSPRNAWPFSPTVSPRSASGRRGGASPRSTSTPGNRRPSWKPSTRPRAQVPARPGAAPLGRRGRVPGQPRVARKEARAPRR
jgi:glycosyltransferase involved in cell wall biosynthesis